MTSKTIDQRSYRRGSIHRGHEPRYSVEKTVAAYRNYELGYDNAMAELERLGLSEIAADRALV